MKLAPRAQWPRNAIDRPKNRSGRLAARLRRDGITAHASYRFNFLAIRDAVPLAGLARLTTRMRISRQLSPWAISAGWFGMS